MAGAQRKARRAWLGNLLLLGASGLFVFAAAELATRAFESAAARKENAGESWAIGTARNIAWASSNLPAGATVSVALSRDGGTSWTTLASAQTASGSLSWTTTAPATTIG